MKYKTDMMDFKELQRKATVNKFQRRLVWSENEKIAFIETLKRGYPFGSILIYKYSGQEDEKYSIVDGLQRYSTMVDFNESPHKYIQDMNRFIDDISNEIIDDDISENTKRNYKRHVETGINELFEVSKEDRNYNTLYTILSQDSLIRENVTPNSEYIYQKQSDLVKHVNEYLDVNDIKIPCI